MLLTKRKDLSMTEGPLFGKILIFILPLMVTNLLQVLYNATDMVVVSLSSELDAVGAIGTTSAFLNMVLNIFIGFSTGANVVVARRLGARDDEGASKAVHTAITMSVIFAAASMGVGFLVARPVLALMGAEGHLLDLALKYTDIYFIGLPFTALSNYAISILRARGDTKTPLLVLSMTGLMNVGLNLMFVLAFDMSVDGVAWATAIANATSALVLLLRLSRDKGACRFSLRKLGIDRSSFRSILTIGLPAGVQGALFALSNMLIQSSILQVNNAIVGEGARFNPVVKGNAAVANLEGFAYTSVNSVYQGAITFTSQNVGAAKYQRVKRVMACCYATAAAVAVLASGTLFLLREPLLSLYDVAPAAADSLEQVAFDTALCRMMYTWIPYFLLSTMEIGCGILRGLGRSLTSTVVSLMGACVFRVIWISTVFRAVGTLESIYLSYPISWGLTGLVLFLFSVKNLRHLIKTKKSEEELLAAAGR